MRDWQGRAAKPLLIMQLQTLSIIRSGVPWKTSLKAKGDRRVFSRREDLDLSTKPALVLES